MLEEMRQTGFAGGLVGASDFIPDHVRDDRGSMIGDHHDFETIGEREAFHLGCSVRLNQRCAKQRKRNHQNFGHG